MRPFTLWVLLHFVIGVWLVAPRTVQACPA